MDDSELIRIFELKVGLGRAQRPEGFTGMAAFLNVVSHHHLWLHEWPLGLWIYHGLHTHHLRTNTIFFQLRFQKIEKLLKNQRNSGNFLFAVCSPSSL